MAAPTSFPGGPSPEEAAGTSRPGTGRPDLAQDQRSLEVLRENERRLRAMVESAPLLIAHLDPEGRCLYVNRHWVELTGLSRERLLGAMWFASIHPEDRRGCLEAFYSATLSADRFSVEGRLLRANGSSLWLRFHVAPGPRRAGAAPDGYLLFGTDIEERRRSEETLAAAKQVAQVGSWELDLSNETAVLSVETYQILGVVPQSGPLPAARLLSHVHPDDRSRVLGAVAAALASAGPVDLEFRIVRADGTVREIHTRTQITRSASGRPAFAIGAVKDVTDRRDSERMLSQREHRLRLLNSIAAGVRAPVTMAQVIGFVVRELHGHFPDCRATYSSIDRALRQKVVDCAPPPHMTDLSGYELDLPRSMAYLATLRQRGPIVIEHPDTDPGIAPVLHGRKLGSVTVLAMPLGLNDQLIGMLALGSPVERHWSEHERDMLREVGDYLTVAIAEVRAKEEQERAVRALEASETQLRDLARQLQTAREKERTRIAREIHDVLGQSLTALQMETALLLQRRGGTGADGQKLLALIDGTIESVQRLAADLRPPQLDDLDLSAAILWEVDELRKRTGIRGECRLPPAVGVLPPEHATTIFRVLQEALTNVVRHAGANHVQVALTIGDGEVTLEVTDDGVGFSPDLAHHPGSLGFLGMRERARALHGSWSVDSAPGRGTRLILRLPLEAGGAGRGGR